MSVKLVSLVLALVVCFAFASPTKKSNYIEQENSCRQVCGLCDCDGFYCEDECICECNLEEDGNLQCIADMKKECDANGLEYELLMQESTKDRFLREVKTNDLDFNKHIVVLKHKRQSSSNSSDIVGNANPESVSNDIGEGGGASSGLTGLGGLHGGISSLAGELQASKLLVLIRERLESLKSINSIAPIAPVVVPPVVVTTISPRVAAIPFKFSLPEFKKLPALSSLPALSTLSLPALSTLSLPKLPTIEALSDLIVQPGNLVES